MSQPAVYVNLVEDVVVSSTATGGVRTIVLTPKQYWGMGLNLAEVTAGLRIRAGFDAGVGVTLKWQWSLDGKTWKSASTTLLTEQITADDFVGTVSAPADLMPFGRVVAEVRHTAGTAQKNAVICAWCYFKYRV